MLLDILPVLWYNEVMNEVLFLSMPPMFRGQAMNLNCSQTLYMRVCVSIPPIITVLLLAFLLFLVYVGMVGVVAFGRETGSKGWRSYARNRVSSTK
jgi:hypothetical protein